METRKLQIPMDRGMVDTLTDADALYGLRDWLRIEYREAVKGGSELDPIDGWVSASVRTLLDMVAKSSSDVFEFTAPTGRTIEFWSRRVWHLRRCRRAVA